MKRGISTFPFLLIFVIIAGAIILTYFFTFGKDILSGSEKVNKLSVLKNIDQQLAAFSLSENALNEKMNLGIKSEIKIGCSQLTNLTFKEQTLKSQKLIVSPVILTGREIKAWTLSWNYPFKIENMYYLFPSEGATRNVQFFYKDSLTLPNEAKKFLNDFRLPINKISNLVSIPAATTDKKIVFILDSSTIPTPSNNIRYVKIDFNQGLSTRKVEVKDQEFFLETSYLSNPMALAAAFSFSDSEYRCIEKLAFSRLKTITSIYKEKINLIKSKLDHKCNIADYNALYDGSTGLLVDLEKLETDLNANPSLLSSAQRINDKNKELSNQNCPSLYFQ